MTTFNNAPKGKLLIYGATRYTGTLIAHEAARRGLDFEIAERSKDKLASLATEQCSLSVISQLWNLHGWEMSL